MMINHFNASLEDSRQLRMLYKHCTKDLHLPSDYCDLLRMSVAYSMSALDKLIHDIVIYGMVEAYSGRRVLTSKFQTEAISLEDHMNLSNSSLPPVEILFENIARQKIRHLSFLEPNKIADALSLVWDEKYKWKRIANAMEKKENDVKVELRNIYRRRNSIVHEADKDPVTNQKTELLEEDVERIEKFIRSLGNEIYHLVHIH